MARLNLRSQLLVSYILLLAVTLGIVTLALLLFLLTRPAPVQPTFDRLNGITQGFNLVALIPELSLSRRPALNAGFASQLADFADTREVRVMVIDLNNGSALFDSADLLRREDSLRLRVSGQQGARNSPFPRIVGMFEDPAENDEWLFTGLIGSRNRALLVADARPAQSLTAVLDDFRASLALPLLQAALVGLLVAVGLAVYISRNIARPLQTVAKATTGVAEGHYDQRVPVRGPTEVRQVAEAFNHMSAEVRLTQQAQQDFVANVSHDLKTPLTSIRGYSQAIIDGAAKNPVQAAAVIHEEAERLNRLVVELTDLARLEAGRLSMATAPVDLSQLAATVGEQLALMAQEKGVRLTVEAQALPPISGDGDRLAQVLTNLLSNAIKYTPAGGEISVRTGVNRGGVELSVRDSGIGILADELPRIFERFYQVDKARGPERGTGLGLAIAREIVHAHGGEIAAMSAGAGHGATFTVWLPLDSAAAHER